MSYWRMSVTVSTLFFKADDLYTKYSLRLVKDPLPLYHDLTNCVTTVQLRANYKMADIKALLNDAGIACAHWLAYLKNNPTYPIPIIVFNAKENFKSYLSKGRKHVRDQQVFKEADVVMKKIMLDQSDAALVEAK